MEVPIRPETVDIRRYGSRLFAKTAEGTLMLIRNADGHQSAGKRVLVELRIGFGHRDFSDIRDKVNMGSTQQLDELLDASVGMADREEGKLHTPPLPDVCSRALALWAAIWSVLSLLISYWGSSFDA